jgi:hypothetical protein
MRIRLCLPLIVLVVFALSAACNSPDTGREPQNGPSEFNAPPDTSSLDPDNPPPAPLPTPQPTPPAPTYSTDVMLFNGTGISTSDWQSTEQIVKSQGLSYDLVNSGQLDAMSVDQMAGYGLMIVPGGSGGTITSGVSGTTRIRVRQAVRDRGMSFLGFCAGAWVGIGPDPGSNAPSYGFALVPGPLLAEYLPGGKQPTAAIVPVSFPNGSVRDLVWWGGPETPQWSKGVIAKYETGKPAISESWAGKGYVIVSGPHPEAPQGWRATAGNDPDGLDYDIAIELIQAALKKEPLPTF